MEKVLSGLDDDWEAAVSGQGEHYGFFYDDHVQLVKELGLYPRAEQFAQPPYGAQFRVMGSKLTFNLIACHIRLEKDGHPGTDEITHLTEVYRHFENMTGNRGITVLAGLFGERSEKVLQAISRVEGDSMIAVNQTLPGGENTGSGGRNLFVSTMFRCHVQKAGIGDSALHPAHIVLRLEN
jgi:hypothetical protein